MQEGESELTLAFNLAEQYSEPKDQKANAEVSPVLAQLPANLPPYHFITSGMDALNSYVTITASHLAKLTFSFTQ